MWQDLAVKDLKPWAVLFGNGESHPYTTNQMHQKFGLADVVIGASVEHKRRGHGIVTANETAAGNPRWNKRSSLLVNVTSDALPAPPKLDGKSAETLWAELQVNNGTTDGPTAGCTLPGLTSARRPVRRALRPQPDQRRCEHEHHGACLLLACTPGSAVSKMQNMS